MDLVLKIVGKIVAYAVLVITLFVALIRGAVTTLWGSQSDFGLLAAILVGVLGTLAILWIAAQLVKNVVKDLNS